MLVTGGGGSIGSELCRQICEFKPRKLLILDIYENNAYELQMELTRKYPNLNLEVLIASIRDKASLNEVFLKYRPNAVSYTHLDVYKRQIIKAVFLLLPIEYIKAWQSGDKNPVRGKTPSHLNPFFM